MRKFTLFLMSLFLSVGAMAQVNYWPQNAPKDNGKKQYDRDMTSVVVGTQNYSLTAAERAKGYVDNYDKVTFQVEPGATYTLEVNTGGSWIHGYVFVDFDSDGFTAGVEDNWKPVGDLVAYAFYNNNSSSDASGWNSKGEYISGDNRNDPNIPSWTVPENLAPGEYRIRFKLDWCNIDPQGDADGKFSDFYDNRGSILDAKLVVVDTNAAREAFNAAYAAAGDVITASAYSVREAEDLPLQTTNPNAEYYIWSNAPESTEGPISQLVDGKTGNQNFFHTQWSSPVPAGPHYIEVDLGEDSDLDEFIIRYSTRINNNGTLADFPDAIEIQGSNEKNGTYTTLATFNENLPQEQGRYWESAVVKNNGYRFLRFNVTAEKTFWHMSEFDITIPASESVNEGYEELIDEIRNLNEVYGNVSDNSDYGYNEYVEATNALTTALAAINLYTLTVTDAGWATLFLDYNTFIPSNVEAYIVSSVNSGYVTLTQVTGVLPKHEGILVKAIPGKYYFVKTSKESGDYSNWLEGTLFDANIQKEEGWSYYVLGMKDGEVGFYNPKYGDDETYFKNGANKAYLLVKGVKDVASYSFRFEGDGTTGIEEVKGENGEVKAIFDLTGRRVEAITAPGIYIVNGKKVLVK